MDAIHVGTNEEKNFWGGSLVVSDLVWLGSQMVLIHSQFDGSTSEGLLRATANYVDKTTDPGTCKELTYLFMSKH